MSWVELPGVSHIFIARDAAPAAIRWINDRFRGALAPSSCRNFFTERTSKLRVGFLNCARLTQYGIGSRSLGITHVRPNQRNVRGRPK